MKNKKKYGKIKILDSLNIIPKNLDDIGKSFLNLKGKDLFPHSFINNKNLYYEGKVPDIKYFNKNKN